MTQIRVSKFDADRQIVWGVVYEPNVPDAHGDFMVADAIEKTAHGFLSKALVHNIDTNHDLEANGSVVVESFVARKGDTDFPEGAWVLAVHVTDDDVWSAVKKGELGGFSLYGTAIRGEEVEIELEIPEDGLVWGETAEHDGHTHRFVAKFDDDGNFLGGYTEEADDGHSHKISRGTVTDEDSDHSHRFNFRSYAK